MIDQTKKVPDHVSENIEKIAEVRLGEAERLNPHQRAVERATLALGRPRTLYFGAAGVAAWVACNTLSKFFGWRAFDPAPFFWLQGALCMYGAFVATMVLAAQNRQRSDSEQRAHLELQVNLLAEQKVTKVIALLEELRRDLPMVVNRSDALADAMQQQADPSALLSVLENVMDGRRPDSPGEPE